MTKNIILFLTTIFVAMPLGGAIFSFVAPWEYDVSASTFLDWHRHIDYYMGKRGAFIGLPSLALLIIQTIIFWRDKEKPKALLVLTTLLLSIVGTVIAIKGNIPINLQLQSLQEGTIPSNWEQIRNEWLSYHFWRNLTAIIGFLCFMTTFFLKSESK